MTGSDDANVVLRDDVVWREGDDAVVVLDTRSSRYLSIGGTGPLLWPQVVAGTTVPALAATLVSTFAIAEPIALRDVVTFVDGLRAHDLLVA